MVKGIIYNPNVEELAKEQSGYMERLWKFNQLNAVRGRQGKSNKSGQISKI